MGSGGLLAPAGSRGRAPGLPFSLNLTPMGLCPGPPSACRTCFGAARRSWTWPAFLSRRTQPSAVAPTDHVMVDPFGHQPPRLAKRCLRMMYAVQRGAALERRHVVRPAAPQLAVGRSPQPARTAAQFPPHRLQLRIVLNTRPAYRSAQHAAMIHDQTPRSRLPSRPPRRKSAATHPPRRRKHHGQRTHQRLGSRRRADNPPIYYWKSAR